MKPRSRRPDPTVIIKAVVETLLSQGADLKAVTLDQFKERLMQTIRLMAEDSKATAI